MSPAAKTKTKTKTQVNTKVLTLTVLALGAAAAFGYMAYRQESKVYRAPGSLYPSYPPAYGAPGTPGYRPLGYETLGYTPPGYAPPGYRKPSEVPPAYLTTGQAACKQTGWLVKSGVQSIASVSKSSFIKASGPTIWWYGANGKRYVVPNEATYRSWYPLGSACPIIYTVTDQDVASVSIAGNVAYRPGVKLVKIASDPKVYAVSKGGELRWMKSEALAKAYYGSKWSKSVDIMPDAFFVTYSLGNPILKLGDYSISKEKNSAPTIDHNLGLK